MTWDVAIVGGGVAGLSCAYALAQAGRSVVVLEQRAACGLEASGRSAAMARQCVGEATFARYAAAGARWFAAPPREVAEQPLLQSVGSMIRYPADAYPSISALVDRNAQFGAQSTMIRAAEAAARSPLAAAWRDGAIVWTPSDGVVDVAQYIAGLERAVRARGGRCVTDARVIALHAEAAQWRLDTPRESFAARAVVNAAGAWADAVAQRAGVTPRGLTAYRRHVVVTQPTAALPQDGPFVWDDAEQWYGRPCDGGALWCLCDETASAPGETQIDDTALARIQRHVAERWPALMQPAAQQWCGQRTFSADRMLQSGWDAHAPRWYWLAGLGGHGITCAPSIGAVAATEIGTRLS